MKKLTPKAQLIIYIIATILLIVISLLLSKFVYNNITCALTKCTRVIL